MRVGWLRKAIRNQDEEASFIAAEDPSVARLSVQRTLDAGSLPLPRAQAVHLEGNAPTFSDALTTARVDSLTGHLTSGVMSAGSECLIAGVSSGLVNDANSANPNAYPTVTVVCP